MNRVLLMGVALTLLAVSGESSARGCLTGAAVGGVAGHVAGKHAVLGAAAGCAINHHRDKVADRQAAAARTAQARQPAPATPNTPTK
jgi:hypothetical protein